MENNYFPYNKPTYSEKIIIPRENNIVKIISAQKFKPTESKKDLLEKYSFIDFDKLLKRNKKKYTVAELREIAKRLDIPPSYPKLQLVDLIKNKIGLE